MWINGVFFPCLGGVFILEKAEDPEQHITHLLWHWAKETLCIPQLIKTISQQQKAISPQWKSNNGVTAQPRATQSHSVQYWSSVLRMLMTVFAVESEVNLFYSYVCVWYLGYISLKGNERHCLPVKMKVFGHFTTVCVLEVWQEWWIQD